MARAEYKLEPGPPPTSSRKMIFTAGIFQNYSSLGNQKTLGVDSSFIHTMDLDQFVAFCQDHKCLQHIWTKDIKAIFEEVKYQNDAQITFQQFLDGLQLISRIVLKHEHYEHSLRLLEAMIIKEHCEAEEVKNPTKKRFMLHSSNSTSRITGGVPRSMAINVQVNKDLYRRSKRRPDPCLRRERYLLEMRKHKRFPVLTKNIP